MKQNFIFTSDNFGFRQVTEDDLNYLVMLDTDPEIRKFFPGGTQSVKEIEEKIKRYSKEYNEKGYGIFLVFALDSEEYIGRAGFADLENGEIEVGYLLLQKFWGKGYATRILQALLSWAKENIHRKRIIAFTPIDHIASERVMQKVGMTFVKRGIMKGVECVIYEFSL